MKKDKGTYYIILLILLIFLIGCVSPKKYQTALDDIARMRVDSTLQANQMAEMQYEKSTELAEAKNELRVKSIKLDSMQLIAQTRKHKLETLSKQFLTSVPTLEGDEISTFTKGGYLHLALPHRILFNTGENELSENGSMVIEKIAQTLQDLETDIMILGHTDSVPVGSTDKDNWKLSFERAHQVMEKMVTNGINPEQIIIAGRGKYAPFLDNETQIGRLLNRRIELILLPDMNEMELLIEQVSQFTND